jgi:hypothetical protein
MINYSYFYTIKLNKMDKLSEKLTIVLAGVLVLVFAALIMALPTMLLWNWLMPTIFKLPEITFWQALGLIALAGCILPKTTVNKD